MNNPATIDTIIDNDFNDINDENDDALSLRDLQMFDHTDASSTHSSPRTSSAQDLFEFFHTISSPPESVDIKVISDSDVEGNDDYLTLFRSPSLKFPNPPVKHVIPMRSVTFSTSAKKLNMTALTSMSSKSKRRMFMFGPVKFLPEMEMSAIRERQGRRAPTQMFPVEKGGGATTTVKVVAGSRKNQRGVVKTLTCRARQNTVFERSLACLRL
ncbi:hypothetical protein LXL04_012517 [Taraxacum kok-saghyz]